MFLKDIASPTHLIIILLIVLVLFGPRKLPEIGGALGRSIREFKSSISNHGDNAEKTTTTTTETVVPPSETLPK